MIFDNQNKKTGFSRLFSACLNTSKGLLWMSKYETAFKQELLLFLPLIICSFFLQITLQEQAVLIGSLLLILLVETINTAIEAVVDRIGLEIHELSGLAKDLGSAAVFISFSIALIAWGAVLCD